MNSKNSRTARVALLLAVLVVAADSTFAEPLVLPAWVAGPDSPITFMDGSTVDAAEAAAELLGFPGIARGISVSDGELRIEAFELSPPPGAAFIAPRYPLTGFEPVPVFRSLALNPGAVGPFLADCSYVRTPDPFGGIFEEGGANLAWDNWRFLAFELTLGAHGLRARNGYVVNLREEAEHDGNLYGNRAAIVMATIIDLRFDTDWRPDPDPGAYADPLVFIPGLGKVAVTSVTLALDDGGLTAIIEAREPSEDEWDLEQALFLRASIDGRGDVVSSVPRSGTAAFGWEGAFELEFDIESAGVPLTGSGLVHLPDSLGGGSFRSAPGAVTAWAGTSWEGENYFEVSEFDEPVRVGYGGWEFVLEDASISRTGDMNHIWALKAPRATLEWRDESILLEALVFSHEGSWLGPDLFEEPLSLPLFAGRFSTQVAGFVEQGIATRGYLHLPPEFGGYSIYIDRLFLYPDGSFDMSDVVWADGFYLPAGGFEFEDGWLSDEGFHFSSMTFDPAWSAVQGSVHFHAGVFPNGGGLEFQGYDPVGIDGFVFFGEAAVRDGVLVMSGGVSYPEALLYGLGQHDPAAVFIPLDGSAPSVHSTVEAEFAVEYGKSGGLRIGRRTIEVMGDSLQVRLDGVRPMLVAPGLKGPSIDGVRITADGAWDFSAAVLADPVDFEREGVAYALDLLVLVDDESVLLSGLATWMDTGGNPKTHGCALSIGFDGSLAIVIAEGDELRYLR